MAEQAKLHKATGQVEWTCTAAIASGEVKQLPDGRAGVYAGLNAAASGDKVTLRSHGVYDVNKSTSVVFLAGQEVWWDDANNRATYALAGDFFVGIAVEDETAASTTVKTDINRARVDDMGGVCARVETTAGAVEIFGGNGNYDFLLSTATEAQKASALGHRGIPLADGPIFEAEINIVDNGDDAALDINVGMANADHASDADAITESAFIHVDGNVLNILAESDDGTTEVAATDTTVDYVVGTAFFAQIDARTLADLQIYINGALVLGATTFKLDAATGPVKALAHIEKSSNNTPGALRVNGMKIYATKAA